MHTGSAQPFVLCSSVLMLAALSDYIFHIPSDEPTSESTLDVAALLPTHRSEVTEPGLPRLGKEPSDHMALLADIVL